MQIMKNTVLAFSALLVFGTASAQTTTQAPKSGLSYNYAELRFVDVDSNGGDGFRLGGSYQLQGPWLLVGAITALDYNNNVDTTLLELGGGYVWNYAKDFDLFGTLRLVRSEVDTTGGSNSDTGFAISAGTRGFIAPKFEVRGSVNHINLDNSDTYLELAGDYYFTDQLSAGLSLEFAGDTDIFTIGARWFFR
jgi:hypothetical protein